MTPYVSDPDFVLWNGDVRDVLPTLEAGSEAHFATYPEELVRRCIAAGCPDAVCPVHGPVVGGPQACTECERSPRRGVVLDPFAGSGTTALVARRLGRRSVGVELNPAYCALAARRLGQQSLLAEGAA